MVSKNCKKSPIKLLLNSNITFTYKIITKNVTIIITITITIIITITITIENRNRNRLGYRKSYRNIFLAKIVQIIYKRYFN